MSEFYNHKLRALAERSNADQMSSKDAFVQGFLMGRKHQREFDARLYNSILKEMHDTGDYKFDENNYWDERIKELEKENFDLKAKYVWSEET